MKRYNALNDIKTDPYEIGICPTCSIRLTHGCEHSQTQLAQEWLAAVIVAEQGFDIEILDAQPTPAEVKAKVDAECETYETRYMNKTIKTIEVTHNFSGITAIATTTWAERHLNNGGG